MSSTELIQLLNEDSLTKELSLNKILKQISFTGKFLLLTEENSITSEELRKFTDIKWIDIPFPPAPTGINQFPLPPEAVVVAKQTLPNRKFQVAIADNAPWEIELYDQVVALVAKWNLVVSATATPDNPFHSTLTVTTGTSSTESFEASLSVSVGTDILGMANVQTYLSETLGFSFIFDHEEKETKVFEIRPTQQKLSVCWWQGSFDFYLSRNARLIQTNSTGVSTADEITGEMLKPLVELYKQGTLLKDSDKTFYSTKYPESNGMSLEENQFVITD